MKKTFALCLIAFGMISACGFQPLYVQKEKQDSLWYFGGKFDVSITTEMSKVAVEPIADRFGQILRNNLLDLLTPRGTPKSPKYRLRVVLKDKRIVQQAMRQDITATSERVEYLVDYSLWEDNQNILSGNSVAFVSYDIMANPYSTTMAQKKTETDAAKIIADDIALRLGAYFHTKLKPKDSSHDL